MALVSVPIISLVQSPLWCRRFEEDEEFKELVKSIECLGVIEPLIVREIGKGMFEIVAGHRRWLAARKAGLSHVPVEVRTISDSEAMEYQIAENVHRKDLSDAEKARLLKTMTQKFGYTQEQLAEKIGKSREWVANHLRMLQLEDVNIVSRETMEKITEGHARAILAVPEEKREEVAKKVEEEIKETGKPPPIRSLVQLVECERCHVRSSSCKPWHGHMLCETCFKKAEFNPEVYDGYFKYLERAKEGKIPEALKPKPFKPQEKWEDRVARMHPQKSEFEESLIQDLIGDGYAIQTDVVFPLEVTKPDGYMEAYKCAIYVDGPPHEKRKDEDELLREKLMQRYPDRVRHVITLAFKSDSKEEKARLKSEFAEQVKWLK